MCPLADIFEIIYKNKALFRLVQSFEVFMSMSTIYLSEAGMSEEDGKKLQEAKNEFIKQIPKYSAGCNYINKSLIPNKRKFKKQSLMPHEQKSDSTTPNEHGSAPKCPFGFTGENPHTKNSPTPTPTPSSTTSTKALHDLSPKMEGLELIMFVLRLPLFWVYSAILIAVTANVTRWLT